MSRSQWTMAAGKFKAECLKVLDEVAATGQDVLITKRGRPVARLVPVERLASGSLAGTIRTVGDIVSPMGDAWDAAT